MAIVKMKRLSLYALAWDREELLKQLVSFEIRANNEAFGSLTYAEDIEITRNEILKRMSIGE